MKILLSAIFSLAVMAHFHGELSKTIYQIDAKKWALAKPPGPRNSYLPATFLAVLYATASSPTKKLSEV